jgi:hypothetical protein
VLRVCCGCTHDQANDPDRRVDDGRQERNVIMRSWMWGLFLGCVLTFGPAVGWRAVGATHGTPDLMQLVAHARLDGVIVDDRGGIASPFGAADDPAIDVWFEEGCDRTYAMGTILHMEYRANVSGLARVWRYPDHEIFVQDWLDAGVTYEISGPVTGPPGRWWLYGELLDSGATATCYYTTTLPIPTPTPTGPTPTPAEPTPTPTEQTATPSSGTPSAVPTPTDVATPGATSTDAPTPSPDATASATQADTPSPSPTATETVTPNPSPSATPEPESATAPPATPTTVPGTPTAVQRTQVWLPLVLVRSTD